MNDISQQRFDDLVGAAFDQIPDELTRMLDNVALFVEDDPPADEPGLLGYYDGIALTDRDVEYSGVLPDRIVIFRHPIIAISDDEHEVIDQIRITVVHEIAHHFGIDDARLDQLGFG